MYIFFINFKQMESESESQSVSHVQLFVTPCTAARQAPLYIGILQARILEWVAIPFSMDLPNPGIKLKSPTLQADS